MCLNETKYLTGIRAYAALSVFLIHSGGLGLRGINGFFDAIVNHGKYGVILFFVLSAYTLALSISLSEKFLWQPYLVKRFCRIIPPYFIIILIMFYFGGAEYYLNRFSIENDFRNLFYHLTFFNVFDYRYQNSLLGVEWSIPIEFFSYAYFPLGYFFFKKQNALVSLGLLALTACWVLFFYPKILRSLYGSDALVVHWSIGRYAFVFILGLFLFRYRNLTKHFGKYSSLAMVLVLVALGPLAYWNENYLVKACDACYRLPNETMALWAALFILVCRGRGSVSRFLFENKVVMFYGNCSYSFYLIHLPVLMYVGQWKLSPFLHGIIALVIATLLSHASYLLLEKPSIRAGKRLIARLASP